MTFNYTLTKEELFNFHKKYILNTSKYKKFLYDCIIIFILITITFLGTVDNSNKFKTFILFIFIGLFLFIFRKKIYLCKFNNIITKFYCDHKKKYLFDPMIIEFSDKGIMLNTSMNDELIKWKGIKDFSIIDENVFIRTFAKDNIFIPKTVIKSQYNLNLIKQLFEKYRKIKPTLMYPKNIEFIIK